MREAVVVDFDGTLVDTEMVHEVCRATIGPDAEAERLWNGGPALDALGWPAPWWT